MSRHRTGEKFERQNVKAPTGRRHEKHPLSTLFTVALLWPAASLSCRPPHISKPCVLTKRRIRAVLYTLHTAVVFALLQQNTCQSQPLAGRERNTSACQVFYFHYLDTDVTIQQHVHGMDENYC